MQLLFTFVILQQHVLFLLRIILPIIITTLEGNVFFERLFLLISILCN